MHGNLKSTKKSLPLHCKGAVGHWWSQRLTALVLVPLSIWLLLLLHHAFNAPYAETLAWLKSPLNALAIGAWNVVVMYHAALGVQVVIEDYVSTLAIRHWAIRLTHLIFLILGVLALAFLILIVMTR
jgi:succinate dehydrogenase / fumarate reductase membrane anchor subunit